VASEMKMPNGAQHTFGRFQSNAMPDFNANTKSGAAFFAGGPVRCVEWCPSLAAHGNEMVAVVAAPGFSVGARRTLEDTAPANNCVQLWAVTAGTNSTAAGGVTPAAPICAIAVDCGYIRRLAWVPTGGCLPADAAKGTLARAGILAVAAGGYIRIYAVPHIADLKAMGGGGGAGSMPVYAPTPIVELDCASTAVMDIAWSPDAGHKKLGCALNDGSFATFSLTDFVPRPIGGGGTPWQSMRRPPPCLQISPTDQFKAQSQTLRAIAWCPEDSDLIAVVGQDDSMQLWDLASKKCIEDIFTMPDKDVWKTALCWPAGRDGLFVVMQGARLRFYDMSADKPSYFFALDPPGSITCIDYSPWLGIATTGSTSGVVQSIVCPRPTFRYPDFGLGMAARRAFQSVQAVMSHSESAQAVVTKGVSAGGGGAAAAGTAGPKVHFKVEHFTTPPGRQPVKQHKEVGAVHYTPPGLDCCSTAVRWSPNQASKFMLAVGFGAGFVVLQDLQSTVSDSYE